MAEIKEAQEWVRRFDEERGFDGFEPLELFMNMNEEMAEIWQKIAWVSEAQKKERARLHRDAIEHDIGDLLHLVLKLANQLEVDPERGLRRALATHSKNHPPRPAREPGEA